MTTFDDREKAYENRYVRDQDLVFRAEARRNREAAHWAADILGKEASDRDHYTADVLAAAIQGGTEAVAGKLVADLASAGVSEHRIRRHMDLELAKALEKIKAE